MIDLKYGGNNLSLLNTIYHNPKKYDGKKYSDALTLVYKDNDTGKKYQEFIEHPEYEYFRYKEGIEIPEYPELCIPADKVEPVRCKYINLEKEIAQATDNLDFFYDNISNGDRYENRRLHSHTTLFNSDMHIEEFYRYKFAQRYGINNMRITKSYLDIEADTIDMKGDFPEMGECPINAVSYFDQANNKMYTFLLRNKENPLIEQFENKLKTNIGKFFKTLRSTIEDTVNGHKNVLRYELDKIDFELFFFDDEVELIADLFRCINTIKADFVLAWNMGFDMPYIIERLKKMGIDPASVISTDEFSIKEARYYVDERNAGMPAERGDNATVSSYSVYLDQMVHFASRRKGQSAVKSFSLDYIGTMIAGVNKLDYSHLTTDIAQFPYLDYELFVIYNIMDVLVQKCIEDRVRDVDYVYNKTVMNNSRYNKCHRNTIYLKSRGTSEFNRHGYIIGNNTNIDTPKVGFSGGLVADPLLNEPNGKVMNGVRTDIRANATDYDYKSLYPSMIREFNIAPNTQIGKIVIENSVFANENVFNDADFDRGGSFIDDFTSRNYLILCSRWFGMANYLDLTKDIIEYYQTKSKYFVNAKPRNIDGLRYGVHMTDKARIPVAFDRPQRSPIQFNRGAKI